MTEELLRPEGYVEVDRSQELSSDPVGDPLIPDKDIGTDNNWVEIKREDPLKQGTYVPEVLMNTEYEDEVGDISKILFTQKDKGFETAVRLDKGNLTWALETFKGISPDVAANVQKIAESRGEAFPQVYSNIEEYQKWQESERIFKSLFNVDTDKKLVYPYTAEWIKDPVKMAQAKDDIELLTEIEGLVTAYMKPWYNIAAHRFKEGGKSILRSGLSTIQAVHELMGDAIETGDYRAEIGRHFMRNNPITAPYIFAEEDLLGSERNEAFAEQLQKVQASDFLRSIPLPDLGGLEQYAYDFVEFLPQLMGTIGATLALGPAGGAGFIGGHIFGSTYEPLRDQGVTPERAAAAAFFNASAQSALEFVGLSTLLKAFSATGGRQILFEFIKAGIVESGTEFLQAFPESAAMIWGRAEKEGEDLGEQINIFLKDLPETSKQGLYEGALVAPVALIGGSGKLAHDYGRSKQLDRDMGFWDDFMGLSENSKLKKRNTEEFEDFANKVISKNEVPDIITISLEAVKNYFQNDIEGLTDFAKEMEIENQIAEAEASGTELEISTAKFAAKYSGTELSLGLRNDIRFDINGMTSNERVVLQEQAVKDLEELRQEYADLSNQNVIPEQALKMREQLILPKDQGGFGLKAEDADANMAVFLAGAGVLSRKKGETMQEWFNRVNPSLEIGGEPISAEGLAQKLVQGPLIEEAKKFKSAEEFIFWANNLDAGEFVENIPINEIIKSDFYKKELLKAQKDITKGIDRKSTAPIRLFLKGDGFELVDGYHRLARAISKKEINIKASIEVVGQEQQLTDIYNQTQREKAFLQEIDVVQELSKRRVIGGFEVTKIDITQEQLESTPTVVAGTSDTRFTVSSNKELFLIYDKLKDDIYKIEHKHKTEKAIKKAGNKIYGIISKDAEVRPPRGEILIPEVTAGKKLTKKQKLAVTQFKQDKDKITRGAVQFTDSQTIINLFKSANLSTFLHETGHIFTEEIKNMIESGIADEQLQKDYDTMLKFADGDLSLKGHEKIARAFEAYLREGKAPSVKLAAAFQRFKAWLTAIYKNIKGLNVELTPEIKGVFDRLLASDEDIREAQTFYSSKKSLADLISVTKVQKEKLEKRKAKADKTAEELNFEKYMRAYLTAIGGRSAIRDLATAEIDNKPVYKALKEMVDTKGLNIEEIKEVYGDEAVKIIKNLNSKAITKKGDISLGELALKYDYGIEQALMDDLQKADKRSEAVNKRTAELLAETEEKIREELQRQENVPGEEAIHNDAALEYLIAETEVLAEKITKSKDRRLTKLEAKVFKDFAKDIISNKKVSEAARYDLYAKSEQKWAKTAYNAALDGDLITAHDAKKKQIINHALVQEAIRARDEKINIENSYKGNTIKSKLKGVEDSYSEIAQDLIKTYKLSTSDKVAPKKENAINSLKELDEVLYSQTPEWILQKRVPEGFESYRDLTMQELRELNDTIKSIMKYGRNELNSLAEDEFKTLESFVNASLQEMNEVKDKAVFDEYSIRGRVLNKIDGFMSRVNMMEFVFEQLDNFKFTKTGKFGPLRTLFNRGVKAETDFSGLKEKTFNTAKPHWDIVYKAKKRLEKKYNGKSFDIPGVPIIESMKKLGRFQWTPERIIAFVLNMGNASSKVVLKNSYGYNDAQIQTITGQLTEAELNAIQGIWDTTNTLFPQLDQTYFNIYNRHLEKIDPEPLIVETSDGKTVELEGGYYPLIFDHELNDVAGKHKEEDLMKNKQTAVFRSTKPKDGATYSRVAGHSLPPNLSLGVWFNHISDVSRYISHAEYLKDLNRITQDKDWRSTARDKIGRPMYNQIRDWVKYQANPNRNLTDPWDRFLEKQRRLATIAILGANLSVGVKQRLSMFSAVKEIGWKWIIEGYRQMDMKGSVLGLSNSEMWQKAIKLSPYLKTRMGSIDREISDIMKRLDPLAKRIEVAGKEYKWKDVQDFMFTWIQMNDRATVGVVWIGAFNKSFSENSELSGEQRTNEAVKFADAIVRTTQPSALPVDLNTLQRSEGMMRLFTSFMTWSFKYGNRLINQNKAYRAGAVSNKDYFRHIMYEVFMAPLGAAAISSLLISGEIPEWWEIFTAPIESAISWVPLLRDVPGSLKYRRPFGSSPAFEGANRILKAGKTAWQVLEDDKEFSQLAWDIGRAIEIQIGVPALKVVKDIKRTYDNIEKIGD